MYEDLIKKATSVAVEKKLSDLCVVGSVGCVLITEKGNTYLGSCLDCACGLGMCAEVSAISQMTTSGESKIKTIVTVSADGKPVPPCGKCRELIFQVNFENMEADVIIRKDQVIKLKDLLPEQWFLNQK